MTPAQLRALSLFDDYVALDATQRARALGELEARDPEAHRTLVAMLEANATTHPLDQFPQELCGHVALDGDIGQDARIGTRLGPWRVTRLISVGGMGSVYEAMRDDGQYQQRVALKCIRRELTNPSLVDAFRNERNTLAQLDHPGIAALIDGGIDPQGHPWFAMRFVDGEPVDVWCDERRAGIRERVELLARACDALSYAHGRMVLHQDIKPSNLLVTDDGNVQLVDFGLATTLSGLDRSRRIAASPDYAAPETFSSAAPATVQDVYSMGMVMHRLLCGRLPHSHSVLASAAMSPPMAESLSSMARQASPEAALARNLPDTRVLSSRLSGDLDAIAARSTAIRPEERYASVADLRDDLLRWLQKRPVHARNGGLPYRAATAMRRHPYASMFAALACIALAAWAVSFHHQTRQTLRQTESYAAMASVFEQTLGNATMSGLSQENFSSGSLLEKAEAQIRQLALDDQPEMLARGLLALARNHAVIGDDRRASRLADEAALLSGTGSVAMSLEIQATQAGLRNRTGQPEEALHIASQALSTPIDDRNIVLLRPRLQLMIEAARAHWDLGQQERAWNMLDQALELAGSRRHTHPEPYIELLILRGQWHNRLQRYPEADVSLREAITLAGTNRPLLKASAERILVRSLLWQQRFEEAGATAESMLQDTRRALGDAHPLTANSLLLAGNSACNQRDFLACRKNIEDGEAIIVETLGKDHPEHGIALAYRAMLEVWEQDRDASIATTREALSILTRHYPDSHETVVHTRSNLASRLVDNAATLGPSERKQANEEARALWETVIATAESNALPPPVSTRGKLARLLMEAGTPQSLADAEALFTKEQETLASLYPPEHFSRSFNQLYLGQLYLKQGRLAEADTVFRELQAQSGAGILHPFSSRLRYQPALGRAEVASRTGQPEEALVLLRKNLALLKERHPQDQRALDATARAIDELERTGKLPPIQ